MPNLPVRLFASTSRCRHNLFFNSAITQQGIRRSTRFGCLPYVDYDLESVYAFEDTRISSGSAGKTRPVKSIHQINHSVWNPTRAPKEHHDVPVDFCLDKIVHIVLGKKFLGFSAVRCGLSCHQFASISRLSPVHHEY